MRVRTAYSFNNAIGGLDDVAERLKKIKLAHFPICDTISTFGFRKWSEICKDYKKQPVYGVEIPVTSKFGEKNPVYDYWSFFATDKLENLNDLITQATSSPDKTPSILFSQIEDLEGFIIVTGSFSPIDEIKHLAKKKDLFFGLSPSTPAGSFLQAKAANFNFLATSDNRYTNEQDRELYKMALGFRANTQSYPQHILSNEEWRDSVSHFTTKNIQATAIRNRNSAFKKCTAEMKKAEILKPKRKKALKKYCLEGAERLGVDLKDKVYKDRLQYELKLIKQKGFEDYFHIIIDMVSWAKKRMVVGPARGSSCGSLVCYLTDITTIDPIKYNLLFERFIDLNRDDLPDIDIDFSDQNRDLVFKYVENKYGVENVARLGSVGTFQPRNALKAIGASLNAPPWEIDKVLDGLIEYHGGDSNANLQLKHTLENTINGEEFLKNYPNSIMACEMEGKPKNASRHAAGIVLTNSKVNEIVAIDARTSSTMCDKKDAEKLDLLKIDALGIKQLTVFERCLELIGEKPRNGFLETIPLDDKKAFAVLNDRKYSGIFQFVGKALQGLGNDIVFDDIEDIISIIALARPGPLNAGGSHAWVRRKNKKEHPTPVHKKLEPYTRATFGVITYQEQIIKIVREIGGLSWADTSTVRKGMSKTLGEEYLNKYKDKFIEGAKKNGIDEIDAKNIWSKILTFGAYAFNRSHSVAYGMMAYYCCYLKAHYPLEFAASTLDTQADPLKQIEMLRELNLEGIKYKPFDLDYSTNHWEIDKKENLLVGPLTNIKGIGEKVQAKIIDARKTGEELSPSIVKRMQNAKTDIDTLTPIKEAISQNISDDEINKFQFRPTLIKNLYPKKSDRAIIIGVVKSVKKKDENSQEMIEKRGYEIKGPDQAVNIFCQDDTGEIFCKIGRFKFGRFGEDFLKNARPGKSLYAFKGRVVPNFPMIDIEMIKYIGELDESS